METNNKKKKRSKWKRRIKRFFILLLVFILLAVGGFVGYTRLKAEYTTTYDTYTATIGTISNSLSYSGSLQLIDNVTYTASGDATVRTVYVAAGDQVKKGDKLVRLSNGQTIEADFDGRVNQMLVEEGDSVSNGSSLVQVADFEHMQVSIRVDEYDIADVKVGQNIRVTTTATEKEFASSIHAINYISSSSGSVAYYTATAYVTVSDGIYPGMQVTITVPQEEASNVVVLKMDALSFDFTNQAYVYMQNSQGEMEQVYVTTGVSNGNYVEITSGLSAGDTVYVEAETTTSGGTANVLSSIFGGTFINGGGSNMGNTSNGTNRDMQTMRQQNSGGNGGTRNGGGN